MDEPSPPPVVSRIPANHPLKARLEALVSEEIRVSGRPWTCKIAVSAAVTTWFLEFVKIAEDAPPESFVLSVVPDQYDELRLREQIRDQTRARPS